MYQVVKRDGNITDFNISKISVAITKAFDATNKQYNPDTIDFLALKVTADYQSKIRDGKIAVEDIQDSVESVLGKAGYDDVAKAFKSISLGDLLCIDHAQGHVVALLDCRDQGGIGDDQAAGNDSIDELVERRLVHGDQHIGV